MAYDMRYGGAMTGFRRGLPPSMKEVSLSENARQFDSETAMRLRLAEIQAELERERLAEEARRFDTTVADERRQQGIANAAALIAPTQQQAMENAGLAEAFNRQVLGNAMGASAAAQAARNAQAAQERLAGRYAADTRSANVALGQEDYNNFNELAARARAASAMLKIQGGQGQLGATGQMQERARIGNRENALISSRDRFQLQVDEARAMAEQARASQLQAMLKMRGMQ